MKGHRHADEDRPAEADQRQLILPLNRAVENKPHDNGVNDDDAESGKDRCADNT